MAFFSSPGKVWLIKKLNERGRPRISRSASQESINHPLMGLPDDPSKDVDEAVQEVRQEVQARMRKGSQVRMPTGTDMKRAVEEKLEKKNSH